MTLTSLATRVTVGFASRAAQTSCDILTQSLRSIIVTAALMVPTVNAQVDLDSKPQTGLPRIGLSAGGQTIQADVAATDESRQKGLMHRTKLARNEGMLFVFAQVGYHAMWMRNTPLNLSVAYMDEKGKILSIHEMEAFTEIPHQSAGPARYALEMNAKWFAQNNVKPGDMIKGLEKAPKPK
jgi:uncharacterized membrane protein (UPF0127 family)